MSEAFQQLLDEMETLAKAMPTNDEDEDEKILDAAGEGDGDPTDDDKDEDDEGEPLGKSFMAVIDGKEVEAIDGTTLVKALMTKVDDSEQTIAKALGQAVDLIKSQGKEINLLKSQVERIGDQGRGRKAVLSVHEKPAAGVPDVPDKVSAPEILSKALEAHGKGRLSSIDVSVIEGCLGRNMEVPNHLLSRLG